MANYLIPELHDCLKLTVLRHDFSDFDRFLLYSPKSRSWAGVIQHHCQEEFPAYPTDRETFLLHMADGFASHFSRHTVSYKGEASFVVRKLWNPDAFRQDSRLSSDKEIIELLRFYEQDPTFEDFAKKYGKLLEARSEDATTGRNVTSLLTHLILTGKFYRLFKNSSVLEVTDKEIIPDLTEIKKLTSEKNKNWRIFLMLCKFNFHQQPFRARDLNILESLHDVVNKITEKYSDNILYWSSDELLICYDDPVLFEEIKKEAFCNGFWLAATYGRAELSQIKNADPATIPGRRTENIYPTELPEKIVPPLCEICQMDQGKMTWPGDYISRNDSAEDIIDEGTEYLCNTCFSIRSRPSKLKKLSRWTEENTDVLYVKGGLNYAHLTGTLQNLYYEYLNSLSSTAKREDAVVRFSMIYEFQRDYGNFIARMQNYIFKIFKPDNVEKILDDMFCIRSAGKGDVFLIIQMMFDLLKEIFPVFLKITDSPIKTSISYCYAKYPFFEVWRDVRSQSADLRINLSGQGHIETSYNYLEDLLLARRENYRKSALHNLAEVAKISERLAEIKFNDRSEKSSFQTYEALKRHLLPMGMDFKSILNFVKLLEV